MFPWTEDAPKLARCPVILMPARLGWGCRSRIPEHQMQPWKIDGGDSLDRAELA